MSLARRNFIKTLSAAMLATPFAAHAAGLDDTPDHSTKEKSMLIARSLKPNDTVGLISPAGATFETENFKIAIESLEAMGLKVKPGRFLKSRYGHLGGRDEDRAEDLNNMFCDQEVRAIIAMRGGSGCGRILDKVDYKVIAANPKIFVGFSDITALLLAIYSKTGLVTFHGPTGSSSWNKFTVDYFRQVLFDAQAVLMQNPISLGDSLAKTQDRIRTIYPGKVQGVIVGGNLAVVTSIIGTPYVPDWKGKILFLEEINEEIYRVDRMMSQLKLAGVLDQIAGVVVGKFTNCSPGERFGSLTVDEVLDDYLQPLKVPVFSGAMIGHINHKFTVPVGGKVEIDADKGTIQMLSPAVE